MGLCMGFSLLSFVEVTTIKYHNSTVFPKCFLCFKLPVPLLVLHPLGNPDHEEEEAKGRRDISGN